MLVNERQKRNNHDILDSIKFTLPIIFSNLFQNMFTIIDHLIVSAHGGDSVLAAIGATANLAAMFTNLVIGISIGASAVIARRIGSNDKEAIQKSIHTSVALGIVGGLVVAIIGMIMSRPILVLMDTPASILDEATRYLMVLCISFLPQTFYNFVSAVLRATGDTKRPLYFLTVAGFVKMGLTYFLVAVLNKGVSYIALTTVISFVISSGLTVYAMARNHNEYHLFFRKIRICPREVKDILITGFPIGLMSSFMSLSNVVMQSAVNSFGELGIAGNTAANHVNNALYSVVSGFSHTSTIFCSRCHGAKDRSGFLRSLKLCLYWMLCCGIGIGGLFFVLRRELVGLFVHSNEAIDYGVEFLNVICFTYALSGAQELLRGALSALNRSIFPMISQIMGYFVFRTVWVKTYFASHHTMTGLYLSYPLSWMITLVLNILFFAIFFHRQYGNRDKAINKI